MISWRKLPSVRAGGKPYFWVGSHKGHTYRVVWDRYKEMWAVVSTSNDSTVAYCATASKGKKLVARL